ncbi:MAG TPA: VOC family protein [Candidatus Saccharimonadales bacterium]|jgi:catechol 2,3-dioxygenase-like lactoylglutathione lyase family enzyme|nr:VOC family protein [Candidatus Saccharimonadales bacterium]
MPILSIDHVQIAIPAASEDRARAFYSGILGFAEVVKPPQMAERKSIWLVTGSVNLHLGIEPDFTPAKRAHPAFVVEGLDKILAACDRAGISSKPDTSFNGFRRVHVFDPFGNRLELMERAKA